MSAATDLERALAGLVDARVVPPCALAPDQWFEGGPRRLADVARACRACPALALCGRVADERSERWGVWGGVDRTLAHAAASES